MSIDKLASAADAGVLSRRDLVLEVMGQLNQFRNLLGWHPTFVNGHQHCLMLPDVAEVLAPVFASVGVTEVRVAVRSASNLQRVTCGTCRNVLDADVQSAAGHYSRFGIQYRYAGLIGPEWCGRRIPRSEFAARLQAATKPCEVMLHPGTCTRDEEALSAYLRNQN